jgi:hypothetical protein
MAEKQVVVGLAHFVNGKPGKTLKSVLSRVHPWLDFYLKIKNTAKSL